MLRASCEYVINLRSRLKAAKVQKRKVRNGLRINKASLAGVAIVLFATAYWVVGIRTDAPYTGDSMIKQAASDKVESRANTARDGNIAIREEFDSAVADNNFEAYDLFIRRHPHHPLAEEARKRIDRLQTDRNRE